jgi:hypothetical protein
MHNKDKIQKAGKAKVSEVSKDQSYNIDIQNRISSSAVEVSHNYSGSSELMLVPRLDVSKR